MKSLSAIEAKYRRGKLRSESTRLWKNTDALIQNEIVRSIELLAEEVIVICFYSNDDYWWVITNKRLIVKESPKVYYIFLSDIEKIRIEDMVYSNSSKLSSQTLFLEYKQGSLGLKLEKGTWHVIYDILKFITH